MVQHGYNTTFDGEGNQFYAVNGIPFHYMHEPIEVRRDELVRIYLVNTLEYDPINSFHIHGNFFDYYPTGTRLEPAEFTDTVIQGQGQRGICELRFPYSGPFMFHAHKTEFAELGWMGFFEVVVMEARGEAIPRSPAGPLGRVPAWGLAAGAAAVIAAVLLVLALVGGDSLPERAGPPIEELAVERTTLEPNLIELSVRNTGPDDVTVAQAFVNDAFVDFSGAEGAIDRLGSETIALTYPWQEGQPYLISLVTSTGAVIEHEIPVAVETPAADGDLFALMALLGIYVGVIPVGLGMLLLPAMRRFKPNWMRVLMAVTVGLLAFLAVDATLEALELAGTSAGAFGGAELLVLGAGLSYLALTAVGRWLSARREAAGAKAGGAQLSLMIALGIGLHNMGEGLAIGSAYAIGELALGAFLVVGFAIHNTTEGFAIVAPLAREKRPSLRRLAALGVIAGAPAILGAVIGASVNNAELSVLLLGVGVGAIVQVIGQILPAVRDREGRLLDGLTASAIAAGVIAFYLTGLLISV